MWIRKSTPSNSHALLENGQSEKNKGSFRESALNPTKDDLNVKYRLLEHKRRKFSK